MKCIKREEHIHNRQKSGKVCQTNQRVATSCSQHVVELIFKIPKKKKISEFLLLYSRLSYLIYSYFSKSVRKRYKSVIPG